MPACSFSRGRRQIRGSSCRTTLSRSEGERQPTGAVGTPWLWAAAHSVTRMAPLHEAGSRTAAPKRPLHSELSISSRQRS